MAFRLAPHPLVTGQEPAESAGHVAALVVFVFFTCLRQRRLESDWEKQGRPESFLFRPVFHQILDPLILSTFLLASVLHSKLDSGYMAIWIEHQGFIEVLVGFSIHVCIFIE